MEEEVILHIGCANRRARGFVNSDKDPHPPDQKMDIRDSWPYEDESVDGIVSVSVFQCLTWRELIFALRESYRVLKSGKIMRVGIPIIENGKPLDYLLGWNNINLFNYSLMERVLLDIGYSKCRKRNYKEGKWSEVDNRPRQIFYMEVIK